MVGCLEWELPALSTLKIRLKGNFRLMSDFYLTHAYVTPLTAASCCQQLLSGVKEE